MTGKAKELGALAVSRVDRRGINVIGGVSGLGLNVTKYGSKSWILRYQVAGKRRDLGLGGYSDVTLAAAREAAREACAKLAQGLDPVQDAPERRSALVAAQASSTFDEAAERYIAAQKPSFTGTSTTFEQPHWTI